MAYYYQCTKIRCFITFVLFLLLELYSQFLARRSHDEDVNCKIVTHYKYQLNNGLDTEMVYENGYNSSYNWFMNKKSQFKNLGEKEKIRYAENTPLCKVDETSLGPITIKKQKNIKELVKEQNTDVKLGGYYAPRQCRAAQRVAVIVPYRDREVHLNIFLRHMHPLLKKQLLEYRIFVMEQYGTERFNKGSLYNIAFLESQRFGTWDCLIFHDVDLVPEDERISYSCPEHPTHMAAAVESFDYVLPYRLNFGGVTAVTPEVYITVNGFSNFYWNWGSEDDDFYVRLKHSNLVVSRYNSSKARYASLAHVYNKKGRERFLLLMLSKMRRQTEGLTTTKYKLLGVTEEKLFTHILADVNPTKMKVDLKSIVQRLIRLHGETIMFGQKEFRLSNPAKLKRPL